MTGDEDVLERLPWAPTIERFSRHALEQAWPRVLTVESALFASGWHKTKDSWGSPIPKDWYGSPIEE